MDKNILKFFSVIVIPFTKPSKKKLFETLRAFEADEMRKISHWIFSKNFIFSPAFPQHRRSILFML
jgi:hypothetical protein